MAKQTANFVDMHIEKVVLAVCGLAFLGTVVFYFFVSPYQSEGMKPAELCQNAKSVADDLVVKTRTGVKQYDPATDPANRTVNMEPIKALQKWFGATADGLRKIAGLDPTSPRTGPLLPTLLPVRGVAEEDRHGLAKLIAPSTPLVTTGHSVLEIEDPMSIEALLKPQPGSRRKEQKEKSWVSVAAQVDLDEQFKQMLAARYPSGQAMSLPILQVHLQRQAVGEDAGEWEDVTPQVPYKPIDLPNLNFISEGQLAVQSSAELDKFRKLIRDAQDLIARPPMPARSEGTKGDDAMSPPLPYLAEPPGAASPTGPMPGPTGTPGPPIDEGDARASVRAKEWCNLAQKALSGGRPFTEADPELALVLARAAVSTKGIKPAEADRASKLVQDATAACKQKKRPVPANPPVEPEHLMPIVAHDLDVIAGRRYVYRIRYEILNPFIGNERMKDPRDAMRITLASEWSAPSRPVEIKSDIYFFATKAIPDRKQIEFTVFKRIAGGQWAWERFAVSPGDPIGSQMKGGKNRGVVFTTGMICVDVDFSSRDAQNDTSVVIANVSDGGLMERFVAKDVGSQRYKDLKNGARAAK